MRVITCILVEHDLGLVALAAFLCIIGCVVTADLWRRAAASSGLNGLSWSFLGGVTAGSSIWATHFIAMLGYRSGVPVSFDAALTIASIIVAIVGTTLAVALTSLRGGTASYAVAGAVFGLSVAAMHYVGMFAYRVDGIVLWDAGYIFASLAAVVATAAFAAVCLRRWSAGAARYVAPGLLVLAIVSLHFTGMAAFAVVPLEGVSRNADSGAFAAMAMAVALVATIIVAAGVASRGIDSRTRSASEEQLRFIALHDALTGLANRRRFAEALTASFAEDSASFSLLAIDLDRFKPVNDSYGHLIGDTVLQRVARRLEAVGREHKLVVARLGGDEFGILARCSEAAAEALASRVVDMLARPLIVEGNVIEMGGSVGLAHAPRQAATAAELTQCADVALYAAKGGGRGTWRVFDQKMNEEVRLRRTLEHGLRRAVSREEFSLVYQPQVDAATGKPTGAEALIRWRHPELGPIAPSTFVPLAEELGLIGTIGGWVLRTACLDACNWPNAAKLAVNLSPLQLADARLPRQVADILAETGFPPERLELEITETALVGKDEMAFEVLRQLKAIGVAISLDDFGTGYSSLTYLHRFPIDRIKIDRSFVQRIPDDAGSMSIVRAIASLGGSLGMDVVAEGIETSEQMRFSAEQGCNHLQGYLFSRPVTAAELAQFLAPPAAEAAA